MGYCSHIGHRFTYSASAGLAVSRNLTPTTRYDEDSFHEEYKYVGAAYASYNHTSWWAVAQGAASYSVLPRWSVFCGPRFTWMLSSLAKKAAYSFEGSDCKLYNVTINAGITWQPGKVKHRAKKENSAAAQ